MKGVFVTRLKRWTEDTTDEERLLRRTAEILVERVLCLGCGEGEQFFHRITLMYEGPDAADIRRLAGQDLAVAKDRWCREHRSVCDGDARRFMVEIEGEVFKRWERRLAP